MKDSYTKKEFATAVRLAIVIGIIIGFVATCVFS